MKIPTDFVLYYILNKTYLRSQISKKPFCLLYFIFFFLQIKTGLKLLLEIHCHFIWVNKLRAPNSQFIMKAFVLGTVMQPRKFAHSCSGF